jgi:hypothetical protein
MSITDTGWSYCLWLPSGSVIAGMIVSRRFSLAQI